jgi:ribosomal protein S6E (S10)
MQPARRYTARSAAPSAESGTLGGRAGAVGAAGGSAGEEGGQLRELHHRQRADGELRGLDVGDADDAALAQLQVDAVRVLVQQPHLRGGLGDHREVPGHQRRRLLLSACPSAHEPLHHLQRLRRVLHVLPSRHPLHKKSKATHTQR